MQPQRRREYELLLAERDRRESIKSQHLEYGPEWLTLTAPTFTWDWPYQSVVQREVRKIIRGHNDRLMLNLPPRHGKSEMVTVRLPPYLLEQNPGHRTIVGAYSQFLANKFSRKSRRIVQQRGKVELSRVRMAVEDWETEAEGGLRAAGVGAGVTGTGGNTIILDDPVKSRKEANSETYREAVWDWYKDDIYTRMEPHSAMIVIMTRWHEDDLGGRLIEEEGLRSEGGEWTVINLPALATDPNDILGRPLGAALCPERYDEKALARIKAVLGRSFEALYQGNPVPAEGNLILREWFRYYAQIPGHFYEIVQSWDTANKPNQINDPSVCTTWMIAPQGFFLLDVWRDRVDFPTLNRTAKDLYSMATTKYGKAPTAVLIEDKASGQSLVQQLRNDTSMSVIAIEPEADKLTRAEATTPLYQAGLVFHPERAHWLPGYESELTSFPEAANDDRVDSMSQFLIWAAKRRHKLEIYGTGTREMLSPQVWGGQTIENVLKSVSGIGKYRGF